MITRALCYSHRVLESHEILKFVCLKKMLYNTVTSQRSIVLFVLVMDNTEIAERLKLSSNKLQIVECHFADKHQNHKRLRWPTVNGKIHMKKWEVILMI